MSWLPVLHRIIVKQDKLEEKDKTTLVLVSRGFTFPI